MTGTMGMETGGVWVLGLDAEGPDGDEVVRRVERSSAGRVRVRTLDEPQLRRWHESAFGEGAALGGPALFEVNGERVRAWEGWRMRFALSRVLGPSATLRVLRDLQGSHAGSPTPKPAGARPPAPSLRCADPQTLLRSRRLTGPDLEEAVLLAARTRDVRNLAGKALTLPASISGARPAAFEHVLRDGTRTRATVFTLSTSRLLAHHHTRDPSRSGDRSSARLWQTGADGRSRLTALSERGAFRPLPSAGTDPGAGSEARERGLCTAIDLACVLNLAGVGGGSSAFFYTLPDTSVGASPDGGSCAGGYRGPSWRCCATFARRRAGRDHNR